MRQTGPSLAEQAMRIMDADGEAAMWEFAKTASADPGPAPVSAELEDGSIIHLVGDSYTFQDTLLLPATKDRTRESYTVRKDLPNVFGVQTPVFATPNRETLCRKILEFLLEQAEEEIKQNGLTPRTPRHSDLRTASEQVRDLLDKNLKIPLDGGPDLVDYIYACMEGVVCDMAAFLPEETKREIQGKV